MSEKTEQQQKKQRHRSPPYPSSSLPDAISYARQFYEEQGKNTVHFESAMSSLGYQAKSSGGARAIASMIAFGLMEDEGSGMARKVKLSDLGYRLMIIKSDDDPDRKALLHEAALKPTIYAEMLKQWPDGLPTDDAIGKYLILERNFNPTSVGPLLKDFRATLAYTNLSGTLSQSNEDSERKPNPPAQPPITGETHRIDDPPPPRQVNTLMTSLVIPIREGVEAELKFPANLTSDEFEDMESYLGTFLTVQKRKVSRQPHLQLGRAIWRHGDLDEPVVIVGEGGVQNGRRFIKVEGSLTGIPFDEIVYE